MTRARQRWWRWLARSTYLYASCSRTEGIMARRPAKKHRGVYERVPGSGVWHIRVKVDGRIVRKRIGPHALAVEEYSKARGKVAEGTYRHQARRRNPTLAEYLDEYVDRNEHRLRSLPTVKRHAKTWKDALGQRTLRQ